MNLENAYSALYTAMLIFIGAALLLVLLRAIKGPKVADRIVAVNMMGTLTVIAIAVCSVLLNAGYLADVCLIYVLISFLAVVALCRIYINISLNKRAHSDAANESEDTNA